MNDGLCTVMSGIGSALSEYFEASADPISFIITIWMGFQFNQMFLLQLPVYNRCFQLPTHDRNFPLFNTVSQDADYLVHVHTESGGVLTVHKDALQYLDLDSLGRALGPRGFSSSS